MTAADSKRLSDEQREALAEIDYRHERGPRKVVYQHDADTVERLLRRVAEGESLYQITQDPDMPGYGTVMDWLYRRRNPPVEPDLFAERYAHAREQQALRWADEIVGISDAEDDPRRAQVRIDARKWVASKLLPSTYGDRQRVEHSGPGGGPIQTEDQATQRLTDLLSGYIEARQQAEQSEGRQLIEQDGAESDDSTS